MNKKIYDEIIKDLNLRNTDADWNQIMVYAAGDLDHAVTLLISKLEKIIVKADTINEVKFYSDQLAKVRLYKSHQLDNSGFKNKEHTVTITQKEYTQLIASRKKLDVLEGAGVDSWDGYDNAMELLHEGNKEI
jgi:hypothetical protein